MVMLHGSFNSIYQLSQCKDQYCSRSCKGVTRADSLVFIVCPIIKCYSRVMQLIFQADLENVVISKGSGGGSAYLVSSFFGLFSVKILEKRPFWCQSLVYRVWGKGLKKGSWIAGSQNFPSLISGSQTKSTVHGRHDGL